MSSGLCRRRNVLRRKCRSRVHWGFSPYHHQNLRLQCVFGLSIPLNICSICISQRKGSAVDRPSLRCYGCGPRRDFLDFRPDTDPRVFYRGFCDCRSCWIFVRNVLQSLSYTVLTGFPRLLLVVYHNKHVQYFAVFCVVSGTYTIIGLMISWCEYPVILPPQFLIRDPCKFHTIWDLKQKERLGCRYI